MLRDVREELSALQKEFQQQVQALRERQTELSLELRSAHQKAVEVRAEEQHMVKREAEKQVRELERRALKRQEELESRFEAKIEVLDASLFAFRLFSWMFVHVHPVLLMFFQGSGRFSLVFSSFCDARATCGTSIAPSTPSRPRC